MSDYRPDRRRVDPDAPRPCKACGRELPPRYFPAYSHRRADGRPYRARTCEACLIAAGKRRPASAKRPRFDGHGNAWCHHCNRYRAVETFPPHPSKPGPWPYCFTCRRELDRLRWTGERRQRMNRQRVENQRRQSARERAERSEFVARAIVTLRRRGLTKSEIAKLADVSIQGVLKWERRDRPPTPAVAERFSIVLHATSHLPIGADSCCRRRLPHPELPALLARCRPLVAAFPVRTRWSRTSSGDGLATEHQEERA